MIKNPWPLNWMPASKTFKEHRLERPFCIYSKRFNLMCFAPRKLCRTCLIKQESAKSADVIHVCDRCGYETTGADEKLTYLTLTNKNGGILATAELCEGCAKMIGEWLKDKDFFDNFWDESPSPFRRE